MTNLSADSTCNLQAPDMPDASVIEVLHTLRASWDALLTCDLLPHQAQACQHIAMLSLPELAAIRQVSFHAHILHSLQ